MIIYLAPLKGVTDAIFRNTYAEFFSGIDRAVSPFISSTKGGRVGRRHLKDVLPQQNMHLPVVPQVLSKAADEFIVLAKALYDLGYATINWNLGCPFPRVARKGRGAGLLPYPDRIDAFLDKTLAAIPNRLSIKTRLGCHSPTELLHLMPVFNRYPLDELIIHPRTGRQMYRGAADVAQFAKYFAMADLPVVYNGDIFSLQDYRRIVQQLPQVSRWMLGRGLLANPFLPAQIRSNGTQRPELGTTFGRFHDALLERYAEALSGPSHLLKRMKCLWHYFAKSFENRPKILKKIHKSQTIGQYQAAVAAVFENEIRRWMAHDTHRRFPF